MTPYFQEGSITLYHGDCREVLPSIRRGLTVTDPPYNVGYTYDRHDDSLSLAEYWRLIGDAVRLPAVFIHYPEAMFPLSRHFRRDPDEVVAWVYHANTPKQWRSISWWAARPDFTNDGQEYRNPTDRRVRALIAAGKSAQLYDWWEIEQVKNVSDEKTEHPCQIPVSLMTRILKVTPFDGDIVDPFAGSGSTLLAAQRLGRKAVGIELSERYCEIIATRLSQLRLGFDDAEAS
jgi:site-specific DNA-methyltransferase (adenine-specific)